MKAATRTTKATQTATAAGKGRSAQVKTPAVKKAAGKPAAKPATKPPVPTPGSKAAGKPPAKAANKAVLTPVAKPKTRTVAKPVAKPATPLKTKPAAPVKAKVVAAPAKPMTKVAAPAKSTVKSPVKAASTSAATAGKSAAVPKAAAAVKPAAKAVKPVSAVKAAPIPAAPAPRPAPIVVEPTPRPLGKRAAKKMMMEQMTQAAVVPTHAPDAAKATFSTMNERVMTPPVPSSVQKDPKRANNWKTLSVEQLTDQDVLAMPDSEYMNDVQMAFFRRKLSSLRADMLANAGETTEHLREDTVVVPDPADRATIEEEHALELRTRDRERKLLKKIEQAIARIDSGDYGYCEETGEAIGVGRLMARPTASLSLEAQQRRELKQKMFGD